MVLRPGLLSFKLASSVSGTKLCRPFGPAVGMQLLEYLCSKSELNLKLFLLVGLGEGKT